MDQIIDLINSALVNLGKRRSRESRLLDAMERLPEKYDFDDNDVELEIRVKLRWEEEGKEKKGWISISREMGHCDSEPFWFEFQPESGENRDLKYRDGRWIFDDHEDEDEEK